MSNDLKAVLSGVRYGFASVARGEIVDDLQLSETFATEREAVERAEDLCVDMAESEVGLQHGEGYWIFEIRPVRFIGRR